METGKDKNCEIIVFANPDEGLKAQRILVTRQIDFKHISTLAVAVPEEKRTEVCALLAEEGALIGGYYPFLFRDYEEDFFKRARRYQPAPEGEFLKSITLCYVAPCIADETKIRLIGYFSSDISEILPYLNTVIKSASYNKNGPTLTFTRARRIINLYNIKVTMAKVNDILDAWEILGELKGLINQTYQNRDKIKPNYERRARITALQIYGWLPKTNCKTCGEMTCLAFAVKLLQGQQKLENCQPLFTEEKFLENKKIMQELIEALGL